MSESFIDDDGHAVFRNEAAYKNYIRRLAAASRNSAARFEDGYEVDAE